MDVEITVDGVELKIRGVGYSTRQVLHLLRVVAGISASLQTAEDEPDRPAVGFSAHLELDPERNVLGVDPDWFED